jgi:hypothetical protein
MHVGGQQSGRVGAVGLGCLPGPPSSVLIAIHTSVTSYGPTLRKV